MGHAIPRQHAAVVLRSHYDHLRALLAIAMVAVVGLSAAVVILASDDNPRCERRLRNAGESAQAEWHRPQRRHRVSALFAHNDLRWVPEHYLARLLLRAEAAVDDLVGLASHFGEGCFPPGRSRCARWATGGQHNTRSRATGGRTPVGADSAFRAKAFDQRQTAAGARSDYGSAARADRVRSRDHRCDALRSPHHLPRAARALAVEDADRIMSPGAPLGITRCGKRRLGFLALALSADETSALDHLPTVGKYLLGPRLAVGTVRLERGSGPLQLVSELFKRRNESVHARPRRVELLEYGLRSDPEQCERSLVAVADCVRVLNECLEETDFIGPVESMYDLGDEIDADSEMIDLERTYFFTGGLIHVVAEERETFYVLGKRVRSDPFGRRSTPIADFIAQGRQRENSLTVASSQ